MMPKMNRKRIFTIMTLKIADMATVRAFIESISP
jgi:hypothetical protein